MTVKSPSKNILVENVYCNWSGGCAMGSLGADTDISDITYKNVYTWKSNQMYMIKSAFAPVSGLYYRLPVLTYLRR